MVLLEGKGGGNIQLILSFISSNTASSQNVKGNNKVNQSLGCFL